MKRLTQYIALVLCCVCGTALTAAGQSLDFSPRPSWLYPSENTKPHRVPARDRERRHSAIIPSTEPSVLWRNVKGSAFRQETKAVTPIQHNLVLLVNFADVKFFYTQKDFDNLLNSDNYTFDGASGSVKQYFYDQLGVQFGFDVVGIIELDKPVIYYGTNNEKGNDQHPGQLVAEACIYAHDSLGINFKDYDCDGDGIVENVSVYFAGQDEAQQTDGKHPEYIWSHSWTLLQSDYKKYLTLDSVKINHYICSSELYLKGKSDTETTTIASIGTFCHEFSHQLGLRDFYDADYEKSDGYAMGTWWYTAIMDGGNYNNQGRTPPYYNVMDRWLLGLPIRALVPGEYTMYPWGTQGAEAYGIANPNDSTEFYLLECRYSGNKWDKYINGSGLLLYHIDVSNKYPQYSERYEEDLNGFQRWVYNDINSRPCVLEGTTPVVCAKGHQCADLIEADMRKDFAVNDEKIDISNISGIFFPQQNAYSIGGKSNIKLSFWDGTESVINITSIKFSNGVATFKVSDSPLPPEPVNPPTESDPLYIIILYSKNPEKGIVKSGTSLYLQASNAYKSTVAWYFNGSTISNPTDFKPSCSGEIRAEITREDGSVDFLFKTIVVE